ncbi:MAG TPA: adenosylcobinamide-GDP ribazoletransferase [Thermoanaerobaculia bacterium]|nr:adenosylcobinamide-GDP ribazoletransferase [Thermoanaerobaculia bacterium]
MTWILQEVRLFWTALTLLTRLPAPRLHGFQEDWLARSAVWFPIVGLIVGGLAAGVHQLAALLWPEPVPAVLALAAAAWVTGGLHEDGWTDVFDGLAASRSGRDPKRMLEAMKDSRIGSTGGLALVLLLLGKLGAITLLPAPRTAAALIAAHVLSRWSHLPLLWRLPYARPEGGMARALAGGVSGTRLTAGTIVTILIAAALLRWTALPPLIFAAAATLAAGLFFRRRLGGITGDCLGATNQLVELGVLLALSARLP